MKKEDIIYKLKRIFDMLEAGEAKGTLQSLIYELEKALEKMLKQKSNTK